MKNIEIDEELYAFIASQTKHIGESASDILRRLLMPESPAPVTPTTEKAVTTTAKPQKKKVTPVKEVQEQSQSIEETPVAAAAPEDLLARITADTLGIYTKRVEQFLFILSQICAVQGDEFKRVEQIKGKNRIYFATSKEALLETGSSTNPKQIPDSEYWVVTNNNTGKKVTMLEQVLQVLGYDEQTVTTVTSCFAPELTK